MSFLIHNQIAGDEISVDVEPQNFPSYWKYPVPFYGNTFDGLESLQTLNLSNNGLQSINIDAFLGLKNLKTLLLDQNYLQMLSSDILISLKNIEKLSVTSNQLENLEDDVFCNSLRLKELDITPGVFAELQLNVLNLEYNYLQEHDIESIKVNTWANYTLCDHQY
ncbi:SLIT and NTRK-like protein 2 [Aphidius gifuensis]|uniref:SLIT and NTRK-like protein 2 n=1 Tax=Aphidius gifuensis TaxID=684658 RepID=UPI001CDBA6A2|nr:SLIT and NTRK-like protein 2 [Aphidius gifuensis]